VDETRGHPIQSLRSPYYRQERSHRLCNARRIEVLGYKRGWSKKKWEDLSARLRSVIIIPYDDAICTVYAELKAELSKSGKTVADNDLWIAACAVRHGLTLLTHNRAHFENIPRLKFLSEAPVIMQIQSQGKLFETKPAKDAASEHKQPSSQSPSS